MVPVPQSLTPSCYCQIPIEEPNTKLHSALLNFSDMLLKKKRTNSAYYSSTSYHKLLLQEDIMHYNGKGIGLIACEWFLTLFQVLAVTIRIYSRTFLTRSVGSDDFLIVLGFVRFMFIMALETFQLTETFRGSKLLRVSVISRLSSMAYPNMRATLRQTNTLQNRSGQNDRYSINTDS